MKFEQVKQKVLNEEMQLIKFRYPSKHCTHPRVLVIDANYPGKVGEKHYGETDDLLGVNLKYVGGARERRRVKAALSSIDLFSDFLEADKLERYNRIKDFCPECLPYIRRYKKDKMRGAKVKRGMFYHPYFLTKKDPYLNKKDESDK